jgi:hypothetical protein
MCNIAFDPLGDVLTPAGSTQTGNLNLGAQIPIADTSCTVQHAQPNPGKVLTGDLDSSLASLAENLSINKSAQAK